MLQMNPPLVSIVDGFSLTLFVYNRLLTEIDVNNCTMQKSYNQMVIKVPMYLMQSNKFINLTIFHNLFHLALLKFPLPC